MTNRLCSRGAKILRGNPVGGKSAPLLREKNILSRKPPWGPFGAPQKGSKRAKKGSIFFSTLAAWFLGARAPLRGAPYAESYAEHGGGGKCAPLAMGVYTGPPLKNTILGRYRPQNPCSRRIPEKSAGPPPRRMTQRGGFPHFFSDFGDNRVWLAGTFLKNWSKQGLPPF